MHNMVDQYVSDTDCVIACYSIDDLYSFQAIPQWLDHFSEQIQGGQTTIAVAGMKADLPVEDRDVPTNLSSELMNDLGE